MAGAWRVQTITGAMTTINPPVELADADNQFRLDYIQESASQLGFDYPPVRGRIYTLCLLSPTPQKKHDHLLFLNNTHNRLTAFRPGLPSYRPVPEETFTHSHPSRSSDILYQLPSFTTIHRILFIQFTCLTVLFDNLSPGPLPLGLGPSTSYSMHFFTQSSSFRSTCPYHRSLFCCNTNAMSSISNLSLSAPYLEICLLA